MKTLRHSKRVVWAVMFAGISASFGITAVARADVSCKKYDLYLDNAGHAVCANTGVDCTVC